MLTLFCSLLLSALGTLIVLLYLQEHAQPFQQVDENPAARAITQRLHRLETFSLLVLIAMVWCAVFFVLSPCDSEDTFCSVLGVSVLGVNALFAVVCAVIFIKACGRKHQLVEKLSKLTEVMRQKSSSRSHTSSSTSGAGNSGANSDLDIFTTIDSGDSEINAVKLNPMMGGSVEIQLTSTIRGTRVLPEGWETAQNEEGQTYYWNEETSEVTWERPTLTA